MLLQEFYNKKPHLYLDMDGVQADFFGEMSKRLHNRKILSTHDDHEAIELLAHSNPEEVYNFFRNLPMLSGGKRIINWLRQHKIPYTILSAPLRGPYADASIQAKKDWLDSHHPGTSDHAIFTRQKYTYAKTDGKPNVLVDDHHKFIDDWKSAGGITVHHDDKHIDRTIDELERIYFQNKDKYK